MELDRRDFYVLYPGHPKFNNLMLIEDNKVRLVIQKYLMVVFTNKGEVYGDPEFGANLELLIHQTKVSANFVERIINEQIAKYIPELLSMNYELSVSFTMDPDSNSDVMLIDFKINEFEVFNFFS